jgi:two-component system sensor histidine kinase BaeS
MKPSKFIEWLQGSGIRLAFIFAVTTTILLLTLNSVVSWQSEGIFVAAVRTIPFGDGEIRELRIQPAPEDYIPGEPQSIENLRTPRQLFNQRFHTALVWVTLLGVLTSALLGFLLCQHFITQPLRRLEQAIAKLKKRDFSATAAPTGVSEFDDVVKEFNELARELERAEVLRKDVISDTSHELKTPLASLQAQLEGMRDGVIPLKRERMGLLLTQVARLNDLTERLQEYTRLRNRTTHLHISTILLQNFVKSLVSEFDTAFKTQGITAVIKIPEDVRLSADQRLLEQVFQNIFTNILAYAQATKVMITFKPGVLTIQDNGKGVPELALSNLFERFFRIERSRNRQTGGLGLGLAIVKEIVEAHGWKITAHTASPHGLAFRITTEPEKS